MNRIDVNFPNQLKDFKFWCQQVLPLVYGNEISYYEVLCKMTVYLNEVIQNMKAAENYLEIFGESYNAIVDMQNKINAEIEKIKNGDYFPQYVDQLAKWIDGNLQNLVGRVVKYVSFGLTMDGHFCAYIPPTWDFLQFDTNMQPHSPLYGHLILRW